MLLRVLSETEFGAEFAVFEPVFQLEHEPASIGAINNAVIIGQRQIHHVADGDDVIALGIGGHHRTLDDVARSQDSYLGLVDDRSEEHMSELQSRGHLVCRLLLEKKKTTSMTKPFIYKQRPQP